MNKVNKEILQEIAHSQMFDLTNDEYDELVNDFNILLEKLDLISKIEGIDAVSPMLFPFDFSILDLREDDVSSSLNKEEVLKNSHSEIDGQISLPKVVG